MGRLQLLCTLASLALLFVGAGCGEDGPGQEELPERVYVSSTADLGWSVEEVVYGKGLSHERDFNADASEPVGLIGDVYVPDSVAGARPALLIVHGGGFVAGTREQHELVEFAEFFAARGWVVMSIDYRLAGDFGTSPPAWIEAAERTEQNSVRLHMAKGVYPAVRDAKAAVRWLQTNADAYEISTDHIAVMGGSAGARISVALGVTDASDFRDELAADEDPTLETTHPDQTGAVAAVIDLWGGASAVDLLEEAFGGEPRWDAGDPPALIVHGTDDRITSIEEGRVVRDRYAASGADFTYVPLEGAGHGAWEASIDGQSLRQLSEAFLLEHLDLTDIAQSRAR